MLSQNFSPRSFLAACGVFLLGFFNAGLPVSAEDKEEIAADGPWVSSVAWVGDEIVGTKSQGLLLRPAEVFRTTADKTNELSQVTEAPTSLWATLPLGDNIVVTDYKGGIHLIEGGEASAVEAEARWIRALAAAPESDQFLAGTEDGKLLVLSSESKKEIQRIDAHDAAIFDIALSPDGKQVVTAGGEGLLKVFSWPELKPLGEMRRGDEAIWSVVFTPDGKHLVSGGADRRLQLWSTESMASVVTITRTGDWVTDLCTLPDSNLVVASCMDGTLVVADTQTMLKVAEVDVAESPIWCMSLHADNKQIVVGTRKNGLALTQVGDWQTTAKQLAEEAQRLLPPSP